MALTILSVAYTFAPVGRDAVGGAEQVLSELDGALLRASHRSIVIACDGSRVAGTLVPVPRVCGPLDEHCIEAARARHYRAIVDSLERWPIDVVHMHGVDFHTYMPPPGVPVLVTLHVPVDWYPKDALQPNRRDTWLHCVSQSQHGTCGPNPRLLPPIENGVATDFFSGRHAKRKFALMLARICPEKGVHLAIEAAKHAGIPLLIAGEVFSHPAHQYYFREEVEPRLDRWRRFIGPIGLARKRRLLAAARCLLVPSLAPETSSLVTREALASGTPVVAFGRGALADMVEHGRTGFLVQDQAGMADAIVNISKIDPGSCRQAARERFSLEGMVHRYFATYEALSRPASEPGGIRAA
jgi:glycosyltransferase involved in cell wall biosynthesis